MSEPMQKIFGPTSPAASLVVCGKTGTGKTTLLAQICKIKQLPCLVIGRHSIDFEKAAKDVFFQPELTDSVKSVRDCCVVVDDLMSLGTKDHALFRDLVCYCKRHQNVTVLVGVHSLNYTGMLSLCSQLDFMAFTQCPPSDVNAKIFMSWHKTGVLEPRHFEAVPERGYLLYSWRSNTVECLTKKLLRVNDDSLTDRDEVKESLRSGVNSILSAFPSKESVAKCLLDFLLRNIDVFDVDRRDFTLSVEGVKASLIDYLLVSQDESGARPMDSIARLHKHWSSKFTIPYSLIRNSFLREGGQNQGETDLARVTDMDVDTEGIKEYFK